MPCHSIIPTIHIDIMTSSKCMYMYCTLDTNRKSPGPTQLNGSGENTVQYKSADIRRNQKKKGGERERRTWHQSRASLRRVSRRYLPISVPVEGVDLVGNVYNVRTCTTIFLLEVNLFDD